MGQETFEKMNDSIKNCYFKGSNHHGTAAIKQVLERLCRTGCLADLAPMRQKRKYTCSRCGAKGHCVNKCSL